MEEGERALAKHGDAGEQGVHHDGLTFHSGHRVGRPAIGRLGAVLVPLIAQTLGWPWAVSSGVLVALIGAVLWGWIRGDRPLEIASALSAPGE